MAHIEVPLSSSSPCSLHANKASTQHFSAKALLLCLRSKMFLLSPECWAKPTIFRNAWRFSKSAFALTSFTAWAQAELILILNPLAFSGVESLPLGLPSTGLSCLAFTKDSVWLRNPCSFPLGWQRCHLLTPWDITVIFVIHSECRLVLEYRSTEGSILIKGGQDAGASPYQVPGWKQMFDESQHHQDSCEHLF